MAARNIEIVITVRDNANKKLKETERAVKRTGKAAKQASADFKGFNRTLFATTAFVATFVKTFSTLGRSLNLGADLDRVDNQFERVLGPSGKMLMNIRGLTDATVDSMEAMKAGIALSNSGITSSSEDTARVIAMSAVAARRAGLDTTEGLKRVVQFAKSGSVASLEFLNLVRTTDPAFTAQIELIKQVGGALGGTLSIQQKYAIGMRALELATKGQMHGFRDLKDVMKGLEDSFGIFRRTVGRFLGAALGPMIDKVTELFYRMSLGLDDLRKNNKEILFLAKSVTVATGAVIGFAGALGTLRLAGMALSSLGFGLPKLIFLVGSLSTMFLGITSTADTFTQKLKVFGGFIQGIYQLISRFDSETGISNIDANLKKLLQENKIFEFAKIVSRGVILVKTTVQDFIDVIKNMAIGVDNFFGGAFRKVIAAISSFNEPWDKALLGMENRTKRMAAVLGLVLGYKVLKPLLGGLLTKIPIVGRLFGGGGKGPKGTITDPIYTVGVGLGGMAGKLGGGKLGGIFSKGLRGLGRTFLSGLKAIPRLLGSGLAGLGRVFMLGIGALPKILGAVMSTVLGKLLAAFGVGYLAGKGLNKLADAYTTQTNKYGQTSNIFERGFGKMATWLPESMGGISDEQYQDMYGQAPPPSTGAEPGKKTSTVNIPTKEDTIDKLDIIGEQMKTMTRADAERLQKATEKALASGEEGAGLITDDEMRKLTGSFGVALDNSKVMNDIRDNTKTSSDKMSSRRGN